MIKKSIYILILLSAVVAVIFAAIDMNNTSSLLPKRQISEATAIEVEGTDSLTVAPDMP